jgi:hypothetical protein
LQRIVENDAQMAADAAADSADGSAEGNDGNESEPNAPA